MIRPVKVCEMCAERTRHVQVRNGVTVCLPCMIVLHQTFLDAPGPAAVRRAARLARLTRQAAGRLP